jgi:integrative and conjugative element protein (TIGR02256 family)
MPVQYVEFGAANLQQDSAALVTERAKVVVAACHHVPGFEIIELRNLAGADADGKQPADVVVVDSINDQVPSRNERNINVRERLALVFFPDPERAPEVRALRADFPIVLHLNQVPAGEPASLCLYFEPWSATQRTWTAQKHLRRILWWIAETAKGTLHRPDQPLEQLYLQSPVELVLPPDFHEKVQDATLALHVAPVEEPTKRRMILRAAFGRKETPAATQWTAVALGLPGAVMHGGVYRPPDSVGELENQLTGRGAPLLEALRACVRDVAAGGVNRTKDGRCVLLLSVPVKRSLDATPEQHQAFAFVLMASLAELGEKLGVLHSVDGGLFYPVPVLGEWVEPESNAWRDIAVAQASIGATVTQQLARQMSGISSEEAAFKAVLGGVGALGGTLMEIWSKASWGSWTLADPDVLRSHNTVRHPARDGYIGRSKVDAMKHIVEANYHRDYYSVRAIADSMTSGQNAELRDALHDAALVVDATTTLEVPRELSRRDQLPRVASVFLTPSGRDSVLLLEDRGRKVRLDSLETQYYRALLNSPWGADHLLGHKGELWVGAGCRDLSKVMSYGTVLLHASILSEQLRRLNASESPQICIWSSSPDSTVRLETIDVEEAHETVRGRWRVLSDAGVGKKLRQMRLSRLPSETGGIILGFTDHQTSTITIVDVWPAPADSLAAPTGFTRGTSNLEAELTEARRRTAHIVGYIGEWHSHPPFARPDPSQDDMLLLSALTRELERDGEPALMLIVGADGEITVHVDGVT